ncbi:MAG TPA: hypothetical protein VGE21_15230, partial [Flavobacteriales bacterium]
MQVLRLHDHDSNGEEDELEEGVLDWSEASTIDIDAPVTQLALTLAEGTGFYIWRVRPLTQWYAEGFTDPRNWCAWSTTPSLSPGFSLSASGTSHSGDDIVVRGTSAGSDAVFFYQQFDDDRNWAYSRTFSEGTANSDIGVRLSERITYATTLLQPQQEQTHLVGSNSTIVGQSVLDHTGRPALSTMAVPITDKVSLGFVHHLLDPIDELTPAANNYSALHFDSDANYDSNTAADQDHGTMYFNYFSTENSNEPEVASAEGYPFSRTLFHPDGRVKQASAPSSSFSFVTSTTAPKTPVTYYSGVAHAELARIFGNEAYQGGAVHQVLTIDANGEASTTYQDKEGKVLATSLIKTSTHPLDSEERPLVGLPSEENDAYSIPVEMPPASPIDQHLSQSISYITVDPPGQGIEIHYSISSDLLNDPSCDVDFCRTCDYTVELFLIDPEHPDDNFIPDDPVPFGTGTWQSFQPIDHEALICSTAVAVQGNLTIGSLPPGIYQLIKRVRTNNLADGPGGPLTTNFEELYQTQIAEEYEGVFAYWDHLVSLLQLPEPANGLEAFFSELGVDPETDPSITLEAGCTTYELPLEPCVPCSVDALDLLNNVLVVEYNNAIDQWNAKYPTTGDDLAHITPFDDLDDDDIEDILPYPESLDPSAKYTGDLFALLLQNMLINGYECEQVRGCWIGAVQVFTAAVAQYGTTNIPIDEETIEEANGGADVEGTMNLHLIDIFLDCAGRRIQGFSDVADCISSPVCAPVVLPAPGTYVMPSSIGYLSHAFACFFMEELDMGDCHDQVEDEFGYPADWHLGSSDPNLEGITGWQYYYDCLLSISPSNPTVEIGDYGDYLDNFLQALRGQCRDACEQRREQFRQGVLALEELELDPENPSDADEIECLVDALVLECGSQCNVASVQGNVLGTDLALEVIQNIISGVPEVSLPEEGLCRSGAKEVEFIQIPHYDEPIGQDLVDRLNRAMNDFVPFMAQGDLQPLLNWDVTPSPFVAGCSNFARWQDPDGCLEIGVGLSWPHYGHTPTCSSCVSTNPAPGNEWFCLECVACDDPSKFAIFNMLIRLNGYIVGALYFLDVPVVTMADMLAAGQNGQPGFTSTRGKFAYDPTPSNSGIRFVMTDGTDWPMAHYPLHPEWSSTYWYAPFSILDPGTSTLDVPFASPVDEVPANMIKYLEGAGCGAKRDCNDALCLGWLPAADFTTHGEADQISILECEDMQEAYYVDLILGLKHDVISAAQERIAEQYRISCGDPANIDDQLTYTFDRKQHHYTLYYYDRAGNLIRTVAPRDVVTMDQLDEEADVSTWQTTPTEHSASSIYTHNSLGQVITQDMPDGGTVRFFYDALGRLRLSQNDRQLAVNSYSYTRYDALGRMIDAGESTEVPSGYGYGGVLTAFLGDEPDDIGRVLSDHPEFPCSLHTFRTTTTYTEPAPGATYLDGTEQRYLLDRVSCSVADGDGDPLTLHDNVTTAYSYDPHGNVEWLMQDIPGLGRMYTAYDYDLISGRVLKVRYNEGRPDQFFHRYAYDADGRIQKAETSIDGRIWDTDASYAYYPHGPLKRTVLGEDQVQGTDHTYTINGWLKGINDHMLTGGDAGGDGTGASTVAHDAFGMMLSYFPGDFQSQSSPFNGAQPGEHPLYNGNISAWAFNTQHHDCEADHDPEAFSAPDPLAFRYRYDALNRIRASISLKIDDGSWHDRASLAWNTTYRYDANGNFFHADSEEPGTPLVALTRNDESGDPMDAITYSYTNGTHHNALSRIDEPIDGDRNDLAEDHTYLYDELGQVV